MATQPRRLRAADLPYVPVEDPLITGYELVDGELVPVSPAGVPHSRVMVELASELNRFVKEGKLGAVFLDIWTRLALPTDPERVRAPDIAFVSREKLRRSGGLSATYLDVLPDLVIEIVSATNERKPRNFQQRVRDYIDAGVQLLWVIFPDARYATIYHADGSARVIREHEALDGEAVLPGFNLPLATLFQVLE